MSHPDLTSALEQVHTARYGAPKLILPLMQVNVWAGRLPQPEPDGLRYLRLPLDAL